MVSLPTEVCLHKGGDHDLGSFFLLDLALLVWCWLQSWQIISFLIILGWLMLSSLINIQGWLMAILEYPGSLTFWFEKTHFLLY